MQALPTSQSNVNSNVYAKDILDMISAGCEKSVHSDLLYNIKKTSAKMIQPNKNRYFSLRNFSRFPIYFGL